MKWSNTTGNRGGSIESEVTPLQKSMNKRVVAGNSKKKKTRVQHWTLKNRAKFGGEEM